MVACQIHLKQMLPVAPTSSIIQKTQQNFRGQQNVVALHCISFLPSRSTSDIHGGTQKKTNEFQFVPINVEQDEERHHLIVSYREEINDYKKMWICLAFRLVLRFGRGHRHIRHNEILVNLFGMIFYLFNGHLLASKKHTVAHSRLGNDAQTAWCIVCPQEHNLFQRTRIAYIQWTARMKRQKKVNVMNYHELFLRSSCYFFFRSQVFVVGQRFLFLSPRCVWLGRRATAITTFNTERYNYVRREKILGWSFFVLFGFLLRDQLLVAVINRRRPTRTHRQ